MNWPTPTIEAVILPTIQADPSARPSETFRYIDISSVDRDAKSITQAIEVLCSEAPSRARKIVQSYDVLVSTVRPNLNAVAFVPEELDEEVASTGFSVLRANPELLNPRFLFYWVQNQAFIDHLCANATGASYPAVSDGIVKRSRIPLPSPKEQSRLIELLDEANRLRRLSREASAKAERILPTLFLSMFGDPETNPMQWTPSTVGQVIVATDYGTSTKASDDGEGLPMIRMGNVDYAGNLDLRDLKYVCLPDKEISKFGLERGDLLFNRTNSIDLVGKTGLWNVEMKAVLASYFIRVRVDREQVEPEFLWAYMNSAFMKRVLRATARGAIGQANINITEIRSLPLNRPPLNVQKDFVAKLKAIQRAIPAAEVSAKLEGLFSLLLIRAFSGELTVKWREAHMKELLAEMEVQARQLNLPMPQEATV
jgi:type I restriction enzyme S subunit